MDIDQKLSSTPPAQPAHAPLDAAKRRGIAVVALLAAALVLAGCGFFGKDTEAASETQLLRAPHPTFTPTSATSEAAPSADQPAPASANAAAAPGDASPGAAQSAPAGAIAPADAPRAVINSPLVNVRSGPGVEFDIVAMVERGLELDITGRSSNGEWWSVCCIDGQPAWVSTELVDTDGAVDGVAVTDAVPASSNAALGGSAAPAAAAPAPTQPPELRFDLEKQEQFAESGLVRVYLYAYADSGALPGYGLRITKDGKELPIAARSFGGQPAFTWPFQDARQRYQNLKVEFPDEPAAGEWTIQLVDSQSQPVGPSATFTLGDNDPNQELYVRYKRR